MDLRVLLMLIAAPPTGVGDFSVIKIGIGEVYVICKKSISVYWSVWYEHEPLTKLHSLSFRL